MLRDDVAKALVRHAQRHPREERGRWTPERSAPDGVELRLRCRPGLEPLVIASLPPQWKPTTLAAGLVGATGLGRIDAVFESRCWYELSFVVLDALNAKVDLVDAVLDAVGRPDVLRWVSALHQGPLRWRVEFPRGGHRRALTARLAIAVDTKQAGWQNAPSGYDTTLRVVDGRRLGVELVPRWTDPRFAGRRSEVPAASHPTVAAALAQVAGAYPDDVVWDPFVGSAMELVERGLRGRYRSLVGYDTDADAIAAATANTEAAGLRDVDLVVRDAFDPAPRGVTLVITNPPFGNRVHFGEDIVAMLSRFVGHAARSLAPGGRMVWLSPVADATAAAARREGLEVTVRRPVDLGGMRVELQRFERPRYRR